MADCPGLRSAVVRDQDDVTSGGARRGAILQLRRSGKARSATTNYPMINPAAWFAPETGLPALTLIGRSIR
jgi:hypothetical protein